ncbi:MAG: vanadium-dependent haloperoxidase [Chitinophagales bacterium]
MLKDIYLVRNVFLIVVMLSCWSCKEGTKAEATVDKALLFAAHKAINDAIIEDGFSPPVASRIYAYSYLGAYKCLPQEATHFQLDLNDFNKTIEFEEAYDSEIASILALLKVAEQLVYRKFIIKQTYDDIVNKLHQTKIPESTIDNAIMAAENVAKAVIDYSKGDNYHNTRNKPFYNISEGYGVWEPTPPMYGTAIEPYWGEIRPFLIDSVDAFLTNYDIQYDTAKGSKFYKEALQVYDTVNIATQQHIDKAQYWDCNPRETLSSGHLMLQVKQMNPPGHWLGIANTIFKREPYQIKEIVEINTITALTMADAIIVCWKEKYTTNLIRPETYINRFIDKSWRPKLETPMFPEYTSGHSVISASAATVLTQLVGDNIAYTDSVNYFLDLAPRSFNSFIEASKEAAISRFYGGIHYLPAIENGYEQGKTIATTVLETKILPK